jgi:hypothetical protein
MSQMRAFILLITVFALLFSSSAGAGEWSGYGELSYAQHSAEQGGNEVLDASHFVQKYSLLWSHEGKLRDGRLGNYDVAIGYEWSWVDSEVNGSDVRIDNPLDKILFKGDVLLAPGGLPFRFNLYSYDLQSSNFAYQELGELFQDQEYDSQKGIITSFNNGSHIVTGMTLVAGVQNGKYRGRYRDLLTALPKLFIDFRQDEVRDLKRPSPVEYVDRNLAFVSLNKNKNWFHYRFFTHEDKLEPVNDFESQTFLIGTIDHFNRRQWVDLTNWIQVSSDLSYSETTPNPGSSESLQKRYDFNMYSTAQRSDWKGGAYMNFSRIRDRQSLEKRIDVPILASGRLNRETTWRLRMENQHEDRDLFSSAEEKTENNVFVSSRLDMFSQSRYMVSPILELEYKESTSSDGLAVRAGAEFYSNQRYRDDADLFAAYDLSIFTGTSATGEGTTYWEQQLEGRYAVDLNRDLRSGVSQELALGSGKYLDSVADFIQADASILSSADGGSVPTDGSYYRSISRWYIDHRPASRIYNRFELNYDYINSPIDSGGQFTVLHNLNYYGRSVTASLDNELIFGNSLHESFEADLDVVGSTQIARTGGTVVNSFESRGRLSYNPDKRHRNELQLELEWRSFDEGGSDQRYRFNQLYEYTFWKNSGLLRRLATVGEEFEYENYTPSLGSSSSLLSFTLFSELYPTRQTLLSARLRYEIDTVAETDTALAFLSASVDFEKFQLEFDYAYGTRTAGVTKPERVEHKWEMKVKKIF